MTICVHGDVCRAWMHSDRTSGNYPLSMMCPYNCIFFEEKIQDGNRDDKRYSVDNLKDRTVYVPRSFSKKW